MKSKSEKNKSEVYLKIRVWLLIIWPVLGILLLLYVWYASSHVEAQPLGTLLTGIYSFLSTIAFIAMLVLKWMAKKADQ